MKRQISYKINKAWKTCRIHVKIAKHQMNKLEMLQDSIRMDKLNKLFVQNHAKITVDFETSKVLIQDCNALLASGNSIREAIDCVIKKDLEKANEP